MIKRKLRQRSSFGKKLRELRHAARLTQDVVARAAGVERAYLAQLEAQTAPSPELAAILGEKLTASLEDQLELVLRGLAMGAPTAARILGRAVEAAERATARERDMNQHLAEMACEGALVFRDFWRRSGAGLDDLEVLDLVQATLAEVRGQLSDDMTYGQRRIAVWNVMVSCADERGLPLPGSG